MMKTFAHEMALILFASSALFSQQAPPEAKMDRGLSLTTTYTESNDSSLGWSTELSLGLEYDISKQWNVSAGIPVYLAQPYSTGIRRQRLKTSYNSMGDSSTTINYNTGLGPIDYATSLTGTAPTGDVTDGASTGQATFNWNNHFEHDIAWITPFIEAGLGNTTPNVSAPLSVRRLAARSHLPYNTLGMLSNYKAGSDFNCGKKLDLEFSGYDVLPFGNQKIFSRGVPRSLAAIATKGTAGQKARLYQLLAIIQGNSSLTKDNGFSGALDFHASKRLELAFEYSRSVPNR